MKLLFILLSTLFLQGNTQYAQGDYADAVASYQQAVAEHPTADGYYNLGNACFKTGDVAQSILAYERCLRIDPRHRDAQHNLRFAEARIIDNIEDKGQFFLARWAAALRDQLSVSTWFVLSISSFLIALAALFVFFFTHPLVLRKAGFHTAWVLLLFSLLSLSAGLSLSHRNTARELAIITQGVVNAKSSPDRSGTDLFVLHEGTKVRISDQLTDWVEIRVADYVGWIPLTALERI